MGKQNTQEETGLDVDLDHGPISQPGYLYLPKPETNHTETRQEMRGVLFNSTRLASQSSASQSELDARFGVIGIRVRIIFMLSLFHISSLMMSCNRHTANEYES